MFKVPISTRVQAVALSRLAWMLVVISGQAGPLEDYVNAPDASFAWKIQERSDGARSTTLHIEMISQTWREHTWTHPMLVVRPKKVRNPDIALLLVGGDGDPAKYRRVLEHLAGEAGAVTAMLAHVPKQPLYNGLREDALIAHTFAEYAKGGDSNWPLLFPMTKSAVRGFDTIAAVVKEAFQQDVKRFVVTGASKRGWTSWLTAAVDARVAGVAPMVIDTLNMPVQLDWAGRVYGRQSEKIGDYTKLRLHERLEEPRIKELLTWVDPYSYRHLYTMPKLVLLGTNDPYWTVDSLRHYWNELPDPKLIHQTPNAGHDLGGAREAIGTLTAFFQMVADGEPLPVITWSLKGGVEDALEIDLESSQPLRTARVWSALSKDRDFRDDKWDDKRLSVTGGGKQVRTVIQPGNEGYRGALIEAELKTRAGLRYKVSTEARVVPDVLPPR